MSGGSGPGKGQSLGFVTVTEKHSWGNQTLIVYTGARNANLGGGWRLLSNEEAEYFVVGETYDDSFTRP